MTSLVRQQLARQLITACVQIITSTLTPTHIRQRTSKKRVYRYNTAVNQTYIVTQSPGHLPPCIIIVSIGST